MTKKGIIIGIFVNKNKILSTLELLKNAFKVNLDKVYTYKIENNEKEYLVTFKVYNKDRFIKNLPNSTILHVKNGCIFSINAINKLIELNYSNLDDKPYNEIEIDWNLYRDKIIILTNGDLKISNLSKIDDKCLFFQSYDIYI